MKQHQGLAIPHRLAGTIVASAEIAQREVFPGRYIFTIHLQGVPTVLAPFALLFLKIVIGQVGGQPLAPVARLLVHVDRVAPPVVQDLVRV